MPYPGENKGRKRISGLLIMCEICAKSLKNIPGMHKALCMFNIVTDVIDYTIY